MSSNANSGTGDIALTEAAASRALFPSPFLSDWYTKFRPATMESNIAGETDTESSFSVSAKQKEQNAKNNVNKQQNLT